jgi:aminobenzoyl-glutamate transport protein
VDADPVPRRGLLDFIERIGNALPDPVALFALGTLAVLLVSHVASCSGWEVTKTVSREVRAPVLDAAGAPVVDPATGAPLSVAALDPASGLVRREVIEEPVRATSLLAPGGLYWLLSSMVPNFVSFPPLGIVLVGMLGIGLADRSGFLSALLRSALLAVPPRLLTPAVVLVGVCSSIALDAGYVVLPPLAAALYHAVGRPPLAGLAAVFAGVAAGFSANLTVTSLDAILAGFSEAGARILDPGYRVAVTANLHFMIASTFVLTGVGWAVTALWIEPRLAAQPADASATAPEDAAPTGLAPHERRALRRGLLALALLLGVLVAAAWIPGAPLHGQDGRTPRWVAAAVPLLFLVFLVPGWVYGAAAGTLRGHREAARCMGEVMAGMGPTSCSPSSRRSSWRASAARASARCSPSRAETCSPGPRFPRRSCSSASCSWWRPRTC